MAGIRAQLNLDVDTRKAKRSLDKAASEINKIVNKQSGKSVNFNVNEKSFTQPLGRINASANEFTKSLEASNARVIAFGASVAIIDGISDAFKNLVVQAVKFEKTMADINAVMSLSSSQIEAFGSKLFEAARNTAQGFDLAAEAALEFSRQGLSTEEVIRRTNDALVLTRLTSLKAKDAVSGLTAAINAFGDAGLTTTDIIDKLSAVDVAFAVSSEDLINALQRSGAVAIDAGVELDKLIGIVAALQQTTARGGAVIGNSLKTIFTRIQRPESIRQIEELGIVVRDLTGAILPADKILLNMARSFNTLTQAQQSNVVQFSAGIFQANVFRAALSDLAKQNSLTAKATEISSQASGEAARKNELLNKTIAAMSSQAATGIQELAAIMGELGLSDSIGNALDFINKRIEEVKGALGGGEEEGSTFAKGLVRGIGNIITGPGAIAFGAIFIKLFVNIAKFASNSMRDVLGIVSQKEKIRQMEESIVNVLSSNLQVQQGLNNLSGDRAAQEAFMLGIIERQTNAMREQKVLAKELASTLIKRNIAPDLSYAPKGTGPVDLDGDGRADSFSASGLIPSEIKQEKKGARKAGYAPGKVASTDIKGVGRVIYNKAETIKKFPGMQQEAIMPPESSRAGSTYKKKFGEKHGFDPYSNQGYIPNYATPKNVVLKNNLTKGDEAMKLRGTPFQNFNKNIVNQLQNDKGQMQGGDITFTTPASNLKTKTYHNIGEYLDALGVSGIQTKIPFDFIQLKTNKKGRMDKNVRTGLTTGTNKQRGDFGEGQFLVSAEGEGYSSTSKDDQAVVDAIKAGSPPVEVKAGSINLQNILEKSIRRYSNKAFRQSLRDVARYHLGSTVENSQIQGFKNNGEIADALMQSVSRLEENTIVDNLRTLAKMGEYTIPGMTSEDLKRSLNKGNFRNDLLQKGIGQNEKDLLSKFGLNQGFIPNFVFTPPIETAEDYQSKTGRSSKSFAAYLALVKAWNASGENFRPLNEQVPGFSSTEYKKGNALLIDGFVDDTGVNDMLWNGKLGYRSAQWSIKDKLKAIGATNLNRSNEYMVKGIPKNKSGVPYQRMYNAIEDAAFGGKFTKGDKTPYSNEDIKNLVVSSGAPIIDEKGHSMIAQERLKGSNGVLTTIKSMQAAMGWTSPKSKGVIGKGANKFKNKLNYGLRNSGTKTIAASGNQIAGVFPSVIGGTTSKSYLGGTIPMELKGKELKNFLNSTFSADQTVYNLFDKATGNTVKAYDFKSASLNEYNWEDTVSHLTGLPLAPYSGAPLDIPPDGEVKFGPSAHRTTQDIVGKKLRYLVSEGHITGWDKSTNSLFARKPITKGLGDVDLYDMLSEGFIPNYNLQLGDEYFSQREVIKGIEKLYLDRVGRKLDKKSAERAAIKYTSLINDAGGKRYPGGRIEIGGKTFNPNEIALALQGHGQFYTPEEGGTVPNFANLIFDKDRIPSKSKDILEEILSSKKRKDLIVGPSGVGKTTLAAQYGDFIQSLEDLQRASSYTILSGAAKTKSGGMSPALEKIISAVNSSKGKVSFLSASDETIEKRRQSRIDSPMKGDLRSEKQLEGTKYAPKNQPEFTQAIRRAAGQFEIINAANGLIPNFGYQDWGMGRKSQPINWKKNQKTGKMSILSGSSSNLDGFGQYLKQVSEKYPDKVKASAAEEFITRAKAYHSVIEKEKAEVNKNTPIGFGRQGRKHYDQMAFVSSRERDVDINGLFIKKLNNHVKQYNKHGYFAADKIERVDSFVNQGLVPNFAFKNTPIRLDGGFGRRGRNISDTESGSFMNYTTNAGNREIDFLQSYRKGDAYRMFQREGQGKFMKQGGAYTSPTLKQQKSFKQGSSANFEDLIYAFPQLQYRMQPNMVTSGKMIHGPAGQRFSFKNLKELKSITNGLDRKQFRDALGAFPGTPGLDVISIQDLTTTKAGKGKGDNIYKQYAEGLIPNFYNLDRRNLGDGDKMSDRQRLLKMWQDKMDEVKKFAKQRKQGGIRKDLDPIISKLNSDANEIWDQIQLLKKGKNYYIPNYANPLSEAISREQAAGIPASKIKIEKSSQLKSPQNPMGLAVTNTRDEPGGVAQGIRRAKSMGIDPKKHGMSAGFVPNYVAGIVGTEGFGQGSLNKPKLKGPASGFSKELEQATDKVREFVSHIELFNAHQKQLNDSSEKVTESNEKQTKSAGDSMMRLFMLQSTLSMANGFLQEFAETGTGVSRKFAELGLGASNLLSTFILLKESSEMLETFLSDKGDEPMVEGVGDIEGMKGVKDSIFKHLGSAKDRGKGFLSKGFEGGRGKALLSMGKSALAAGKQLLRFAPIVGKGILIMQGVNEAFKLIGWDVMSHFKSGAEKAAERLEQLSKSTETLENALGALQSQTENSEKIKELEALGSRRTQKQEEEFFSLKLKSFDIESKLQKSMSKLYDENIMGTDIAEKLNNQFTDNTSTVADQTKTLQKLILVQKQRVALEEGTKAFDELIENKFDSFFEMLDLGDKDGDFLKQASGFRGAQAGRVLSQAMISDDDLSESEKIKILENNIKVIGQFDLNELQDSSVGKVSDILSKQLQGTEFFGGTLMAESLKEMLDSIDNAKDNISGFTGKEAEAADTSLKAVVKQLRKLKKDLQDSSEGEGIAQSTKELRDEYVRVIAQFKNQRDLAVHQNTLSNQINDTQRKIAESNDGILSQYNGISASTAIRNKTARDLALIDQKFQTDTLQAQQKALDALNKQATTTISTNQLSNVFKDDKEKGAQNFQENLSKGISGDNIANINKKLDTALSASQAKQINDIFKRVGSKAKEMEDNQAIVNELIAEYGKVKDATVASAILVAIHEKAISTLTEDQIQELKKTNRELERKNQLLEVGRKNEIELTKQKEIETLISKKTVEGARKLQKKLQEQGNFSEVLTQAIKGEAATKAVINQHEKDRVSLLLRQQESGQKAFELQVGKNRTDAESAILSLDQVKAQLKLLDATNKGTEEQNNIIRIQKAKFAQEVFSAKLAEQEAKARNEFFLFDETRKKIAQSQIETELQNAKTEEAINLEKLKTQISSNKISELVEAQTSSELTNTQRSALIAAQKVEILKEGQKQAEQMRRATELQEASNKFIELDNAIRKASMSSKDMNTDVGLDFTIEKANEILSIRQNNAKNLMLTDTEELAQFVSNQLDQEILSAENSALIASEKAIILSSMGKQGELIAQANELQETSNKVSAMENAIRKASVNRMQLETSVRAQVGAEKADSIRGTREAAQRALITEKPEDALAFAESLKQTNIELGNGSRAMDQLRVRMAQLRVESENLGADLVDIGLDEARTGLKNLFMDIGTGAKSASEAFEDFGLNIAKAILDRMMQDSIDKIISDLTFAFTGEDGGMSDADKIAGSNNHLVEALNKLSSIELDVLGESMRSFQADFKEGIKLNTGDLDQKMLKQVGQLKTPLETLGQRIGELATAIEKDAQNRSVKGSKEGEDDIMKRQPERFDVATLNTKSLVVANQKAPDIESDPRVEKLKNIKLESKLNEKSDLEFRIQKFEDDLAQLKNKETQPISFNNREEALNYYQENIPMSQRHFNYRRKKSRIDYVNKEKAQELAQLMHEKTGFDPLDSEQDSYINITGDRFPKAERVNMVNEPSGYIDPFAPGEFMSFNQKIPKTQDIALNPENRGSTTAFDELNRPDQSAKKLELENTIRELKEQFSQLEKTINRSVEDKSSKDLSKKPATSQDIKLNVKAVNDNSQKSIDVMSGDFGDLKKINSGISATLNEIKVELIRKRNTPDPNPSPDPNPDPDLKHMGGKIQKFAKGGLVQGPAGQDRVPAMLTAGEYVIPKDQVGKYKEGGFVKNLAKEFNNEDSNSRGVKAAQAVTRAATMYATTEYMNDTLNKKFDKPPTFDKNRLNQLKLDSTVSLAKGDPRLSSKFLNEDPVMDEYRQHLMDKAAYEVQKKNRKFEKKKALLGAIVGAYTSFLTSTVISPVVSAAAGYVKEKAKNLVQGSMGFGKYSEPYQNLKASGVDIDYSEVEASFNKGQKMQYSRGEELYEATPQGIAYDKNFEPLDTPAFGFTDEKNIGSTYSRKGKSEPTFFEKITKRLNTGGKVPAMLTAGESVIPAETAKKIGYARLSKINSSGDLPIVKGPAGIDKVGPVGLTEGDFVIKKSATDKLVKTNSNIMRFSNLSSGNTRQAPKRYYQGGIVGTSGSSNPSTFSGGQSQPNQQGSQTSTAVQPLLESVNSNQKQAVSQSTNNEVTNNINVNVSIDQSGNEQVSSDSGANSVEQEQALAMKIKTKVIEVIREEKRIGGELS